MRSRFNGFVGGDELDGDKGNTTSTVKVRIVFPCNQVSSLKLPFPLQVVDNHKVTINDTVYKKDTPYGTQFVKVRTVHVKPLNESDESDAEPNPTPTPKVDEEKPEEEDRDTELLESDNDESNQVLNERQTDKHDGAKSGKLKGSATI